MSKQIRILRLLEYSGTEDELKKHLTQRGVVGSSPSNWNGGRVVIRESFISNELGPWEMPPVEEGVSDGYSIARRHLDAIDQAERVMNVLDWRRPFQPSATVVGMPSPMAEALARQAYAGWAYSPATQSTNPKD
jgi:hypothetical protein